MKESLPISCLEQMNFRPCPCRDFLNPAGMCFEPDPSLGEGYYWFYEKKGMFAVGRMDLRLRSEYTMEFVQPPFICIKYFDDISAVELEPRREMSSNCILGRVSDESCYRITARKNVPIRGTELMLMPGYYRDYLGSRYQGEFPDTKEALDSIDGSRDFPELVLILKQLVKFRGDGMAAEMYYEGKINEALSLIIEKTKSDGRKKEPRACDDSGLDDVKSYIEEHLGEDMKSGVLASVACMGQTKLRSTFKASCGMTLTEYIRERRIARASELLLSTSMNVGQVAEAVGYRHAGRFSALFKESTGLNPDEYRKTVK